MKLKDFIKLYNFRYYNEEALDENNKYDSSLIRLMFDTRKWIYIGADDFGEGGALSNIENFVKKEVLNMNIFTVSLNSDLDCLDIYLEKEND